MPDGGKSGVWGAAGFSNTIYDEANEGISFGIGSSSTTWYPASGRRHDDNGKLLNVGYDGGYWAISPYDGYAYCLIIKNNGDVHIALNNYRADGFSIRCLQVID